MKTGQSIISDFWYEAKHEDLSTSRDFIEHPLIKKNTIESRSYQVEIAQKALRKNTLVVLPTGLGKTVIAALVVAEILRKKGGKVLFLAPTKPLVNQHLDTFQRFLIAEGMGILTGSIAPKERIKVWEKSKIIFSTPQVINNDVLRGRYSLEGVTLIIFDEGHRAIGKYAYVSIAKNYVDTCNSPLILAMTASPGGERKKIKKVISNLFIEDIQARRRDDPDVARYVKRVEVIWKKTQLNREMKDIQRLLESLLYEKIERLHKLGFLTYKKKLYISKKDLIMTRETIQKRISRTRQSHLFGAMQQLAIAIQAYHCLELLETQGVTPLEKYLKRLYSKSEPNKSEKGFINDLRCRKAYALAEEFLFVSHPKIDLLKRVIERQFSEKKDSLAIVFAQYRDTINSILDELKGIDIKAVKFIGQASRNEEKGLTQDEQKAILNDFRQRVYNILVASSVAEEGLDIPNVDLVVFYEPIPSEIRSIQRRGRTGRSDIGKVVILITEKTRDEGYLFAEISREKKMGNVLKWLKRGMAAS